MVFFFFINFFFKIEVLLIRLLYFDLDILRYFSLYFDIGIYFSLQNILKFLYNILNRYTFIFDDVENRQ